MPPNLKTKQRCFSRSIICKRKQVYQPRHNEFLISFVAENLDCLANVRNLPYFDITVLLERPTFGRQDPNDTDGMEVSLTHFCALLRTHRPENPDEFKVKISSIINAINKNNVMVRSNAEFNKLVNLKIPTKEMDLKWYLAQPYISAIIGKRNKGKKKDGTDVFREFLLKHPVESSLQPRETIQNREWVSTMEKSKREKIPGSIKIRGDTKQMWSTQKVKRSTYFMISVEWPPDIQPTRHFETFHLERQVMYEVMFDASFQKATDWEFFHMEWILQERTDDTECVNLKSITFSIELEQATAMCTLQRKFRDHGKLMKMMHIDFPTPALADYWNYFFGKSEASTNIITWKGLTKKEELIRKENLQKRNSVLVSDDSMDQCVSMWETKTKDVADDASLFHYTMIRHKWMGFISEKSFYNLVDQSTENPLIIVKYKVKYNSFDIKHGYLEESALENFFLFSDPSPKRHDLIQSVTIYPLPTTQEESDEASKDSCCSTEHFEYIPLVQQCFALFIRLKTSKPFTYKTQESGVEVMKIKKRRIKLFYSGFSNVLSRLAKIFFNKDVIPLLCTESDLKNTGVLTKNDGVHFVAMSQ